MYFCKKIFSTELTPDCGLVTNQESGEDSFRSNAERRSAAALPKSDVLLESRGRAADYGVAMLHTIFGADASGVVAESGIELHQFIRRVFLILGRKVLTIAAYLPATHFERLWIAHITWVQDF